MSVWILVYIILVSLLSQLGAHEKVLACPYALPFLSSPDPLYFQRMNKFNWRESTVAFPLLICFFLFIFHVFFLLRLFSFFWSFFSFLLSLIFLLTHQVCSSVTPPPPPPPHMNTDRNFSAACVWLYTDTHRCKHTREGHRMCELFVLFPFDELSSVGTARGFDRSDLSTLWKTVNTLSDPLLCLCLWTFHSPLMRISPNYFSGCSRGTAVYLDLDTGTWLLCW